VNPWLPDTLVSSFIPYTLQTTEAGFHRVLKNMGVPLGEYPKFANPYASTVKLTKGDESKIIVSVRTDKKVDKIKMYCVLVHEAVHIWQHIKEDIGETNPSMEFEAYSIEQISRNLIQEYERQLKKKVK
jgi:hypothetical protein